MSYRKTRADFEELEKIAELGDYGPIEENMIALMRTASKAHAETLYRLAIHLWFKEHLTEVVASENHDAAEIAWIYGIECVIK